MKCTLNVTDHEYDKILQMNHDTVVWDNADRRLLDGIAKLLGPEVAHDLFQYTECRMEKHHEMKGIPRVAPVLA